MRMEAQSRLDRDPGLIGHYAGFISRLLAFLIDTVILAITLIIVSWFVNITFDMLQLRPIFKFLISSAGLQPVADLIFTPITAGLLSFGFIIAYHIFFWVSAGQTPGKALMGIRVVPTRGGKISLWRAILRYACYYLSGILLGLGFLWIIIDDKRMAWHDKISGTCVIYVWDARPDETFLTAATKIFRARQESLHELQKQRDRLRELVAFEDDQSSIDGDSQSSK